MIRKEYLVRPKVARKKWWRRAQLESNLQAWLALRTIDSDLHAYKLKLPGMEVYGIFTMLYEFYMATNRGYREAYSVDRRHIDTICSDQR